MMSRLERIKTMLEADPNDTFLRYALAMEYRSGGDSTGAIREFQSLMKAAKPHVPSFFMCGQVLAEQGDIEGARATLRNGIDHARTQGDHHAAGEMSELLTSLGPLGE